MRRIPALAVFVAASVLFAADPPSPAPAPTPAKAAAPVPAAAVSP